jgi:hypothetical protein
MPTSPSTVESTAASNRPESLVPSRFAVWLEYEKIAIHFNDLILRLRIQALGGVAAISALAGLVVNEKVPADLRWKVLGFAFSVLTVFWLALAILDLCYYSRLLRGAVAAILEVEKEGTPDWPRPAISTLIETAADGSDKASAGKRKAPWAPCFYYWVVGLSLATLSVLSFLR